MSVRNTLRAFPTLLRVSFSEVVAYRAELVVWTLATTMPLVMLALWSAVARDEPIGRYGQAEFVAYFLVTFIVRQLTGSWAAWQMNLEVRQGTLAMRLLRPVHPLWGYAIENVAAMPARVLVSVPVAVAILATVGADEVTRAPEMWALASIAVVGGWLITLFANLCIGCLAFFIESSTKLMDVWLVAYFVFSGYLIPVDLFPPGLRAIADGLPFRYQIGLPVEILVGAHDGAFAQTLSLIAVQWGWVLAMLGLTMLTWRVGLRRFSAYGG